MPRQVRRYATIDSTNEEALRLARAGAHGPVWIVATVQTGGRGRRGRTWVSQPGNLFATWLIEVAVDRGGELAFVAGLAAADMVLCFAPSASVRLKWPNDVLLNGRKVAGILLERERRTLAVGIGVNLAHSPDDAAFPATALASVAPLPSQEEAFARLADRMDAWYEVWSRDGFAPIRTSWIARASGLGGAIRVRLGDGDVHGLFEDVDGDGALILRADGRPVRITAGDVFFGA